MLKRVVEIADQLVRSADAEAFSLAEELGLEVASMIPRRTDAPSANSQIEWGDAYQAVLLGGKTLVDAQLRLKAPLACVGLAYFCADLDSRFRHVPVATWIAHLLLRDEHRVFDKESWLAMHAREWLRDAWGAHLLSKHGLPSEQAPDFGWFPLHPSIGIGCLDPHWDDDYQSDHMTEDEYPSLLWSLRKRRNLPPVLMALIKMYKSIQEMKAHPDRVSEGMPAKAALKFVGAHASLAPKNVIELFAPPNSLDEPLAEETKAWLELLTADEMRALYLSALGAAAYPYTIVSEFYRCFPDQELVPANLWSSRLNGPGTN